MATRTIELHDLRVAGGVMLGAAVVRPLIPLHVGVTCPLRRFTGIPCPFCGMTTSVTGAVRGHWHDALMANPVGLLAVVVAVVLLGIPRLQRVNVPRWLPHAGLTLMWAWELVRFRIL
jgi:hypothetical protein